MRESVQADVGLVNAGAIRGDRVYPAGPLTRRLLLAMHPFGNVVVKLELPGRVLLATLTHAVSALPATAGRFPQVSGVKFDVDIHEPPPRLVNVLVNGQPLDPDRTYTVALPDYLFSGRRRLRHAAGSQGARQHRRPESWSSASWSVTSRRESASRPRWKGASRSSGR